MKRTKVLLINPSLKDSIITEVPLIITKFLGRQYNLGLLYLISSLREHEQHLEIDFFDAAYLNKSYAGIIAYVLDYNPDLIGITSVTHNIVTVLKIVQIIKRHLPRVHINLGGPHISLFPKDSLLYLGVDSITVGDGENSFLNLALNLKNNRDYDIDGIYFKSKNYSSYKPELVENLDSLLPPARDLIVNKRYGYRLNSGHKITTMISSRGCPYSCSFCMVPNIKYRRRSVSSVLSEIDCCKKMGFDEIYFVDDTFNSDVDWLKDFISGVKDKDILWSCRARIVGIDEPLMRSLKESNCVRMHFGVETPNSEALKIFNKGITVEEVKNVFILSRKYNIKTVGYFLIGSPNETSKKDILNTIDFALSLDPNYAMFNILTIYPKTELYGLALEKGVVNKSLWSQFIENPYRDFKLPFWQEYFDREQLYSFLTKAYVKFYCRPKGIISAIRTLTK